MKNIIKLNNYFKNNYFSEHSFFEQAALFLAFLIIFWSPFKGGPRLPSFALVLLGGLLLWRKLENEVPSATRQRLVSVFLLLWLPVLLSVPNSVYLPTSLLVALAMGLYGFMGLSLIWVLRTSRNLDWLERAIGLCLLLWLIDGWMQYLLGYDLLGIPLDAEGRVVGFFRKLRLSTFLSVLAPFLLWRVARFNPWLAWLVYGLVATVVILSGARSAWLMVALAGGLLFFHTPHHWKVKVAVAAITAILIIPVVATSDLVRMKVATSIGTGTFQLSELDQMSSGRVLIWDTGIRMVLDRPLFGIGAGAFVKVYDSYSERSDDRFRSNGLEGLSHAHQLYLSIAAETGLIGLVGFIVACFLGARWYQQGTLLQREHAAPWAAALFIALFPINSQPVLLSLWWFPVLLLLLCGFLSALSIPDSAREQDTQP